jgi:hypothetical protein
LSCFKEGMTGSGGSDMLLDGAVAADEDFLLWTPPPPLVISSLICIPKRLFPNDKEVRLFNFAREGDIDPWASLLCSQLSDFNASKLAKASGSALSLLFERSNVRTVTNWNTAEGMVDNPWLVSESTPVLEAVSIFFLI